MLSGTLGGRSLFQKGNEIQNAVASKSVDGPISAMSDLGGLRNVCFLSLFAKYGRTSGSFQFRLRRLGG